MPLFEKLASLSFGLIAFLLFCSQASAPAATPKPEDVALLDLNGSEVKPLANPGSAITVFVFVRTDCPISNRYAPEVRRISATYTPKKVQFWVVYPDPDETAPLISTHLKDYDFGCKPLRDTGHSLVRLAKVAITPEVAIFKGPELIYHGRIDNKFADFGKARPEPTSHELSAALDALLDGRLPAVSHVPAVGCAIPDLK
jgi:hypothetical protein